VFDENIDRVGEPARFVQHIRASDEQARRPAGLEAALGSGPRVVRAHLLMRTSAAALRAAR
jgi:hypothetical protein